MLWGHWVSLTCFSGPSSADSAPPSAGWVQTQSSSTLAWPETDWNSEAARSRSVWWGHCVSTLLPLSRRLRGSWRPAAERRADTARSCAWRTGGGGAGWPRTPRRETPQRRSPGTAQFTPHVLPQCTVIVTWWTARTEILPGRRTWCHWCDPWTEWCFRTESGRTEAPPRKRWFFLRWKFKEFI